MSLNENLDDIHCKEKNKGLHLEDCPALIPWYHHSAGIENECEP